MIRISFEFPGVSEALDFLSRNSDVDGVVTNPVPVKERKKRTPAAPPTPEPVAAPAAVPQEPPAEARPLTVEDVRAALGALVSKKGVARGKGVLNRFNADVLTLRPGESSETKRVLPSDKWPDFITACYNASLID